MLQNKWSTNSLSTLTTLVSPKQWERARGRLGLAFTGARSLLTERHRCSQLSELLKELEQEERERVFLSFVGWLAGVRLTEWLAGAKLGLHLGGAAELRQLLPARPLLSLPKLGGRLFPLGKKRRTREGAALAARPQAGKHFPSNFHLLFSCCCCAAAAAAASAARAHRKFALDGRQAAETMDQSEFVLPTRRAQEESPAAS